MQNLDRIRGALGLLIFLVLSCEAGAAEFTFGPRTLRVPDGFTVELVAGPPLVERPISVSRDESGRLYATDSAGMSDRADKQRELKPHRIRRLEDPDGDGRYDTSVLFAEGMMFPEGCLWHEGSLYVAAPPEIWKLTDADGDGRAEKREAWFDGKTLTGCANDLHGPYLGRDGWIYWCKGAFAEQRHTLPNGKPFVTRSSHIFRSRPDGTQLEPVLTGGMDNPVNVAFLTTGERILSCTFFQFPEAGRRDGLIHAIYGGVYGKKHDSIYEHQQTGDVMPVLVHEGAAAPCGLTSGGDQLFGGGYVDQLFACYFNLHKVVRHRLVPNGATFRTEDEDFLACDHPDFHPTDVFEDADGSLIVVDTGGWYKVCCPTSQLAKPDVLGAIYRVRKTGMPAVPDPLGQKLDWSVGPEELARRLSDPRLFVQRRATGLLRRAGAPAIGPLARLVTHDPSPATRRQALWTLSGIDDASARQAARAGLLDGEPSVVHVALQTAGLWRDGDSLGRLLEIVTADDPVLQRAAAEAIGRIGDKRAVPALLKAIERLGPSSPDESGAPSESAARVREHSLLYALIEIGDAEGTVAALSSPLPHVRRAGLVALDQMDEGGLSADAVIPQLDSSDPVLRNTASWIVGHRPEWGPALVSFFQNRLAHPATAAPERKELTRLMARLAKSPVIQQMLADVLRNPQNRECRPLVLDAMSEAGLSVTPPAWFDELARLLPLAKNEELAPTVLTARLLPQPKDGHGAIQAALLAVGRRADVPIAVRLDAFLAAGPLTAVENPVFETLAKASSEDEPLGIRGAAASILGTAALSAEQQRQLLAAVRKAGPLELPKLLPAYEKGGNEELGLPLVTALRESNGLSGLRFDVAQKLLAKYPPAVREAGKPLLDRLNAGAAEQAALITQLLAELPTGDARRGHEVFLGKKAACITCHTLGYQGGRLGPDLTNIGKVRNERDLLEAIVYPSASFVRGYEPVVVQLTDGRVLSGIIARESRDEIVLGIDAQKTQHIARDSIEEIHPSPASLMPLGMLKVLTLQELSDLVAFLKTPQR